MAVVVDPGGDRLVASLRAAGGNMTGFTIFGPQIGPSACEILKRRSGVKACRRGVEFRQSCEATSQLPLHRRGGPWGWGIRNRKFAPVQNAASLHQLFEKFRALGQASRGDHGAGSDAVQ